MNKLLWTLVVVVTSSVAASLSVRLLDRGYRRFAKQPPPEMPKWARLLVSPVKKQVVTSVEPSTPV